MLDAVISISRAAFEKKLCKKTRAQASPGSVPTTAWIMAPKESWEAYIDLA